MTKDLVVLDKRSQKFHNNNFLGINDSYLRYISSLSLIVNLQNLSNLWSWLVNPAPL